MSKIKFVLKKIILYMFYPKRKQKLIEIYSDDELISLINQGASLGRYGDGELSLIFGNNIGFQEKNKGLSYKLCEVLENYNKETSNNFIVGMPKIFNNSDGFLQEVKIYWLWYSFKNYRNICKLLGKVKYANANITRPYIDYEKKDYSEFKNRFEKIQKIWEDKDLIFVEGEFTKLGVGNDLFDNARSIKRIICPNQNAFKKYKEIYNSIKNNYKGELILLALGPTATVLSYELSQNENIQCVDIGHIDIEYMWYLNKAQSKESVYGKYVNESLNNNCVSKNDSKYLNQIIDSIL